MRRSHMMRPDSQYTYCGRRVTTDKCDGATGLPIDIADDGTCKTCVQYKLHRRGFLIASWRSTKSGPPVGPMIDRYRAAGWYQHCAELELQEPRVERQLTSLAAEAGRYMEGVRR